jgi:hypothetical protein
MAAAQAALKLFFEEKEIEHRTFHVSHNEQSHMIESDFLQDVIINHTPKNEQEKIRAVIAQIDFRNGDVNHFLEHLANAYVKTNF